MVVAGLLLIVFMVWMEATYYATQEIGDWKMRAVLALAGGAMAVGFTGNINIKLHWVQASGSLAVVLLLYFVNPVQIEREIVPPDVVGTGAHNTGFWIVGSAYAQDPSSAGEAPTHAQASNAPKYKMRIDYPIGIKDLKTQSFDLRADLKGQWETQEVKVYSIGSKLRAPVNFITYDGLKEVQIKYNRLVSPSAVRDIKRTLEAKYKDTKVKVSAEEGVTRDSDIQIQLVPK